MTNISTITVYNNEGFHIEPGRRYMITFRPFTASIEYQDLAYTTPSETAHFCDDFNDIVAFLLDQLDTNLGAHASLRNTFKSPTEYKNWRRSLDFTDNDVSWSVSIEFEDGRFASYVSIEGGAIPAELDELELLVKETLKIV